MRKFNQPKFKLVFLAIDFICLSISFFLALVKVIPHFWDVSYNHFFFGFSHFNLFLVFVVVFLFSFRYNNLYKRNVISAHLRQFVLLLKALVAGSIVCILVMVISNIDYLSDYGKDLIFYFFLYCAGLLSMFRAILGREIFKFIIKNKIFRRYVLIVGSDKAGLHVLESLRNDDFTDFLIVGFLDDYKDVGAKITDEFDNLGNLSDLQMIAERLKIDEIIIAIDHAPYDRLIQVVETCLRTGKYVRIYSDLLNVVADKMDVELYANIPVIELPQHSLNSPVVSDKRTLDIVLAALSLLILAPLYLAIAVGIKVSSKGPVIFKQTRVGKNGRTFNFYKFRSMHMGMADIKHKEYVQNFIKGDPENDAKQIKVFKITDDPRIFKFGRFLRKTSLDEFPQLFNVLKGEMALVGPRPCLPYEWDCYEDWHKKRLNILPGCTGLWQALGRNTVTFEEMVTLDLYYISNISLWLDLKIILKTFPVIFLGKGGY